MPLKASKRYKMRKEATLWIECLWISWKLTPSHFARVFSLLLFWSFPSLSQWLKLRSDSPLYQQRARIHAYVPQTSDSVNEMGGEWKERKKMQEKRQDTSSTCVRTSFYSFLRSSCSSPFRCIQTKTNEPYIAFASIYYGYVALKTT